MILRLLGAAAELLYIPRSPFPCSFYVVLEQCLFPFPLIILCREIRVHVVESDQGG
jgi:hypothetical protein